MRVVGEPLRFVFPSVLFACALVVSGCDDASHCYDCGGFPGPYADPTSPENQIQNLETSYKNRDCQGYGRLLAPEFTFHFQPYDANTIGMTFWSHDPDSAGTCALFKSGEVSEIRISLLNLVPDSIDASPPVDSLKIRISTVDLQVDQTDGVTWVVTDQQDLFFRKGLTANGENPNYWWIYEWDDLPTLSAPAIAVRSITWGSLKARY